MVEGLTNEDFRELGVNTIGGRARLRAAARDWRQLQGTREGQELDAREGQDTENVVQEAGLEVSPLVQDAGLEVGPVVQEAGQEVIQEERQGQEEDAHREEDNGLTFVETITMTGKIWHNFFFQNYKLCCQKVKPNGRAYFECSFPGCTAGLKADYTDKESSNTWAFAGCD